LLIIHDKALAERYIVNWQEHEEHSEEYVTEQGIKPSHCEELIEET